MGEYIAKPGDGWYRIAKNTGVDVNTLLKLNNANLNTPVYVGLTIKTLNTTTKPTFNNTQSAPKKKLIPRTSFDKKANAKALQTVLKNNPFKRVYYSGNIDGDWGPGSRAAMILSFKDAGYDQASINAMMNYVNNNIYSEGFDIKKMYEFGNKKSTLQPKSKTSVNTDNIAYVNFPGYKAYGFMPTGHAGLVVKDDSGMFTFYDYGTSHSAKSGFTRLNQKVSPQNTDYRKVDLGRNLTDEELGNALSKYFPDNEEISFYWKSGDTNAAVDYLNNRAKTHYDKYSSLNNNCSSEAECAMEAAGIDFDGSIPSIDHPTWNAPANARRYDWKRTYSDKEIAEREQHEQQVQQQNEDAKILYNKLYKGKTPDQIRAIALERSRAANAAPNKNFLNAMDMLEDKRVKATENRTGAYSNCINTVTGFYNPTQTVSSNVSFTLTPSAYGFEEVSEQEAQPGDIGILHNTDDHPYHAVMLDNKAKDGSWNLNYSNGGSKYRRNVNISAFKSPGQKHKFKNVKYYRYVGNNNGPIDNVLQTIAPALRFANSML